MREDKLLDLYDQTLEGESTQLMKKRKRMIAKLWKEEYRRWLLKYLINNVRRGPKKPLKYIQVKDNSRKVIKTIYNQLELEKALIE